MKGLVMRILVTSILIFACIFGPSSYAREWVPVLINYEKFETNKAFVDSLQRSPLYHDLKNYMESNSLSKRRPLKLEKREDYFVFTEAPYVKIKFDEESGNLNFKANGKESTLIGAMGFNSMKREIERILEPEKSVFNGLFIQDAYAIEPLVVPFIVFVAIGIHSAFLLYKQDHLEEKVKKLKNKCSTTPSSPEAVALYHQISQLDEDVCSNGFFKVYKGQTDKICEELALTKKCFYELTQKVKRIDQSDRGQVKLIDSNKKENLKNETSSQ